MLRFGDQRLLKGTWPIIGLLPNWNPAEWPMVDHVRRDPLGLLKPLLVRYDDNDPEKIVSFEKLEHDLDLPTEGFAGSGYVENVLSSLLK